MATPEQYVAAQNGAVRLAVRDLRRYWATLELSDGVAVRKALEDYWPVLLGKYGEITATLAADRFEELVGLPATMVRPVDPERANARMRWALDPLFTQEGDALARLELLTDELVKQPGRSTTIRSAHDNGIRFARVPTGAKTCDFCLMLAGRGAVYANATTAGEGNKFHGKCDCRIEPIRDDADIARLGVADGPTTLASKARGVNWGGLSPQEAAAELQKVLGDRGKVAGFEKLNPYAAREVAQTLAELYEAHPTVRADVLVGDIRSKGAAGEASSKLLSYDRATKLGTYGDMSITLDPRKLATNQADDRAQVDRLAEQGWLSMQPGSGVTLARYVATHEFGHLVDYTGGRGQRRPALKRADNKSMDLNIGRDMMAADGVKGIRTTAANEWRDRNISKYGQTLPGETIAEAFADVKINGSRASKLSQAIYREMTEAAASGEGVTGS